jgi:hypothetical protein
MVYPTPRKKKISKTARFEKGPIHRCRDADLEKDPAEM